MSKGWSFCITIGPYTAYADETNPIPKYRKRIDAGPDWLTNPIDAADIPYNIREQVIEILEVCKQTKVVLDQLPTE